MEKNYLVLGLPVARLKPGPLHELIVQFALSENHLHGLITSTSSFIVVIILQLLVFTPVMRSGMKLLNES